MIATALRSHPISLKWTAGLQDCRALAVVFLLVDESERGGLGSAVRVGDSIRRRMFLIIINGRRDPKM
jgi:hypothetical protein